MRIFRMMKKAKKKFILSQHLDGYHNYINKNSCIFCKDSNSYSARKFNMLVLLTQNDLIQTITDLSEFPLCIIFLNIFADVNVRLLYYSIWINAIHTFYFTTRYFPHTAKLWPPNSVLPLPARFFEKSLRHTDKNFYPFRPGIVPKYSSFITTIPLICISFPSHLHIMCVSKRARIKV